MDYYFGINGRYLHDVCCTATNEKILERQKSRRHIFIDVRFIDDRTLTLVPLWANSKRHYAYLDKQNFSNAPRGHAIPHDQVSQ